MSDETPIGTKTVNEHGKEITVISKEVIHTPFNLYNVLTREHLNCFADGILTSCRLNNMYPIQGMRFKKDAAPRPSFTVADFPGVPEEWITSLRLSEQPKTTSLEEMQAYVWRILKTDKRTAVLFEKAA